jgi:hypothetical protein
MLLQGRLFLIIKGQVLGRTLFRIYKLRIFKIRRRLYAMNMHEKLQTPYAKRIFKKRGSTVEPVLGTMLNFLNLKRVNTRGIKQDNKHCLMSALTYNLKKYLKFTKNKKEDYVHANQK